MAPSLPYIPLFDPRRLRSYLLRLPLFTRIVFFFVVGFWLLGFQTIWNIVQWGALIPKEVNLGTSMSRGQEKLPLIVVYLHMEKFQLTRFLTVVYRLNTYPLIHVNLLNAAFNALALVPLLERFESEHGTLLTGAMFAGRACILLHKRLPKSSLNILLCSPLYPSSRRIPFD